VTKKCVAIESITQLEQHNREIPEEYRFILLDKEYEALQEKCNEEILTHYGEVVSDEIVREVGINGESEEILSRDGSLNRPNNEDPNRPDNNQDPTRSNDDEDIHHPNKDITDDLALEVLPESGEATRDMVSSDDFNLIPAIAGEESDQIGFTPLADPTDIQLTAVISATDQTVRVHKRFPNAFAVDW
jgi:hypothetical protein